MASTAKQYGLIFELSARLGPNFSQSFKNASKVMNTLQGDLSNASKKLKDVSAYQKQQSEVAKSRERVSELQAEHKKLVDEIEATGEATPELTKKLQANEKALQKAQDATEKHEKRLKDLSDTLKKAGVSTDDLSKDTSKLRDEYERLEKSQKKVQEITGKQTKNSEAIARTKGQLTGLIGTATALAGSFFALDSATQEYRNNQSKLNTAFQAAGYSTQTAKEAYAGFYKILGDNDTATEASQLLAQLTRSEKDVAKWTDIAAGVYGTFGASLPIEALIESANESSRCGKITGNLADAINWASKEGETFGVVLKEDTKENEAWNKAVKEAETAEDYFNLALQSCSTEAERNKLIMDTLQSTYQKATDAFYENNKQIVKSRQSQIVWNDLLAKCGVIAGTVKSALTGMLGISADGSVEANSALEKLSTTLDKIAENPELIATVTKVVTALVGVKAGGLVAKMGFLNVQNGIFEMQKTFANVQGLGITKYLKSMTGGFGGILGKVAPLVGIIAAVGGAIYYVSTHLEEVRGFIKKTFGEDALAIFDKLWGVISQVGTAVKEVFLSEGSGFLDSLKNVLPSIIDTLRTSFLPVLPMITDLIVQIAPLIGEFASEILPLLFQCMTSLLPVLATLTGAILPVIVSLVQAALPLLLQIVQAVLPIFIQLVNTILPILVQIIQSVLPVIIQLVQTLLPVLMQIIQTVLPVVINLLNTLIPIFNTILQAILPPLQILLQGLIPIIQFVAQVFANTLGSALRSVGVIVQNIMQIFQGLIDFITGVFTGNWSQAWEGVKSIFSGVFGNLGEIFKAPFRTVVSTINTVIQGLNQLKVPDWVPGIGGQSINIPQIPGFAKGTNRTPDTFIAGEKGPELITNAANRKVFTAAQTGRIFNNMAQAHNLNTPRSVNATLSGTGTITIQVTNNPVVMVQSGDTQSIKAQLEQYDETFLEKLRNIILAILKEQKEGEDRVVYA